MSFFESIFGLTSRSKHEQTSNRLREAEAQNMALNNLMATQNMAFSVEQKRRDDDARRRYSSSSGLYSTGASARRSGAGFSGVLGL